MRVPPYPPDIEALLDAERQAPDEPESRKSAARAALMAAIGVIPPGGGGGASGGPAAGSDTGAEAGSTGAGPVAGAGAPTLTAAAGLSRLVVVSALTFVAGAGTGALAYHQLAPRPSAPEPARSSVEPALTGASEAGPSAASDDELPAVTEASAGAPAVDASRAEGPAASGDEAVGRVAAGARVQPRPAAPDQGRERQLIEVARSAVARGNAGTALEALARHRAQFPGGQLAEEREALRVLALVAAGRLAEAREGARAFRRRYRRSIFSDAIDRALARHGGDADPTAPERP